MTKNKKRGLKRAGSWLALVLGLLLIGLGAWALANVLLPHYLIGYIQSSLTEACPACEIAIGAMTLNPVDGEVGLRSVSFAGDPQDSTVLKVKFGELKLKYDVGALWRQKIEINQLDLVNLIVTVEERYRPESAVDKKKEKAPSTEPTYGGQFLESLPVMRFERINLHHARLDYILKIFGHHAQFTVAEINAKISALGTRRSHSPRFTTVNLTGRVQGSGALTFRCRADLFSVKNEDQIEIELRHQKMADLDAFFVKEEGMHMDGEVVKAQANINLDQGMLTGILTAEYHDLAIHVQPTPETSGLKAFLINFLGGLKIEKTKTAASKPPPAAPINYKREPGQGLIKFILAGLKDAAMKVVSK